MKPLPLLLLAGGGYFLYSYLNKQGALPSITGAAAGPSPTPAVDNSAAIAAAAAKAEADRVSAQTAATVDDSLLERAAANAAWVGPTNGARLKWDQWNWYLAKYATVNNLPAQPSYAPEDVGITDRNLLMTAQQYHDYKTAKGLAGIGRYFVAPGYLPHFEVD